MAQIIITARDRKTGLDFDVEVPNDLEADKLLDDLIQALMGADPNLFWDLYSTRLLNPKTGREIAPDRTLREEGIWNGDYLLIQG